MKTPKYEYISVGFRFNDPSALKNYGLDGWHVVSVTPSTPHGFWRALMERTFPEPEPEKRSDWYHGPYY